jgi:hypothetical protein
MITYGRIYFQIGSLPERYVTIRHCADIDALKDFCVVLSPWTRSRITHCELIASVWFDSYESDGDYGDLDMRGIIKFRDRTEDHKLHTIPLPAPSDEMFEDVQGKLRLKESVGETITQAYCLMSGQPFDFEHGWLTGNTYN